MQQPTEASDCQLTTDLTSTCLQMSLGVAYGQQVKSPSHFGFLDQNYHNKSVATQIPPNAGKALIPYTVQKLLPQ